MTRAELRGFAQAPKDVIQSFTQPKTLAVRSLRKLVALGPLALSENNELEGKKTQRCEVPLIAHEMTSKTEMTKTL